MVITIIVLLILAGVALATLTGQGNIIGNAENAVGKHNDSVGSEKQFLNEIEKYFQNYLQGGNGDNSPNTSGQTGPVDENGLATENVIIKPDENSDVQIVIPEGFAPAILATGTTQSLPGEDGSVASIMPYEQWNNITVEDINKGIVIVDHAITYTEEVPDFNEYVWIPIPNFEEDFQTIAWTTLNGYDVNGNWVMDTEVTQSIANNPLTEAEKENKFWDDFNTQEYQDMLDSIEHYKGFYIGRYEASQGANNFAQSKRNLFPVSANYQTAKELCKNEEKNITRHLMYGIEWDSVLSWLVENAKISSSIVGELTIMTRNDIETSSSTWGNYLDSTGSAEEEPWERENRQNTGTSEYWKANNIYDFAGNSLEWTQEKYSTATNRTVRGGNYNNNGNYSPVAMRAHYDENSIYLYVRLPCQLLYLTTSRCPSISTRLVPSLKLMQINGIIDI